MIALPNIELLTGADAELMRLQVTGENQIKMFARDLASIREREPA